MAIMMSGAAAFLMGLMLTLTAGNDRCDCRNLYWFAVPLMVVGAVVVVVTIARRRSQVAR